MMPGLELFDIISLTAAMVISAVLLVAVIDVLLIESVRKD